jgi:hypothetical protein
LTCAAVSAFHLLLTVLPYVPAKRGPFELNQQTPRQCYSSSHLLLSVCMNISLLPPPTIICFVAAGVLVDLPVLGPKDVEDVQQFAAKHKMDFIAASFVQNADDVRSA